jgi:hypothetical protein
MPDRRGHSRVSRRLFEQLGWPWTTTAFLARHRRIDRDPSLLGHRDWDHTAEALLQAGTPEEVLEWLGHLAVDYALVPEWRAIAVRKEESS